jgi:hypothetical protein
MMKTWLDGMLDVLDGTEEADTPLRGQMPCVRCFQDVLSGRARAEAVPQPNRLCAIHGGAIEGQVRHEL